MLTGVKWITDKKRNFFLKNIVKKHLLLEENNYDHTVTLQ